MNVARGGTLHPAPARRRRPRGPPARRWAPSTAPTTTCGSPRARSPRAPPARTPRDQVAPPPGRSTRLGEGLVGPAGATLDELPEAIEDPERRFALGVQWHPEADPSVAADRRAGARGGGGAQRRLTEPRSAARGAMLARAVRRSTAIRLAACTALAAGVAAPLVRRRLKLPPPVVTATAATAPFALCVLVPRSRKRDVAVVVPADVGLRRDLPDAQRRPDALERRVRIDYPVRVDRALGLGMTPTLRLQRAFGRPGRINARRADADLVALDLVPRPARHGRCTCCCATASASRAARACSTATFDLGLIGYWAVPTAPPWYAARAGPDGRRADAGAAADDGRVRRAVLEVQLGAAVRFPWRESARRHALPALRHVRHGRPPALRDRPRRRARRLGLRDARSGWRSSTSASTTSSTSPPGSR